MSFGSCSSSSGNAQKTQIEREEMAGMIKFKACSNDLSDENMVLLMAARDLYVSLLPSLVERVIVRQVMERTHKSILAITDGRVVGAATYHPFPGHMFAEVVLFAVSVGHQRRGLGTRLMDLVKQCAVEKDEVSHMVVFASENSTLFFSKQGFVEELTLLDGRRMACCDKLSFHYSVPMELNIQPRSIPHMINTKPAETSAGVGIDLDSFPAEIFAAGWSPAMWVGMDFDVGQEDLQKLLHVMLRSVRFHPDSYPFLLAVDPVMMPDYYEVVSDPIDLTIVTERVESGIYYRKLDMFVSDLRKMFENWRTYRRGKTLNGYLANRLEFYFYDKLRIELKEVRKLRNIGNGDNEISSCSSSSEDDDDDDDDDDGDKEDEEENPSYIGRKDDHGDKEDEGKNPSYICGKDDHGDQEDEGKNPSYIRGKDDHGDQEDEGKNPSCIGGKDDNFEEEEKKMKDVRKGKRKIFE